jgi:alkylation response protein AidB-like acyl-CoA dehydrogenase
MWRADERAAREQYVRLGRELEEVLARARRQRVATAQPFRALSDTGLFTGVFGPGERLTESAAAIEGLLYGARDGGLASAVIIHHCACSIVARFGSAALVERFVARCVQGPCSVAMTEPRGGTAAFEPATRLRETPGGLRLQGEKWHITSAPLAPAYVIFAFDERAGGVSAVLVERDAPGVAVDALQPSGMRSAAVGRLRLDTVVPADAVLGSPGDGVRVFQDATEREKVLVAFATTGIVERLLDDALAYVHQRHSGGAPLASHQYVRGRITELKVGLEATRGLAHAALHRLVAGEDAGVEAAVAKLFAAETGIAAGLHAMKLLGSHGYEDGGLSDVLLSAVGASLGGGSEEAQREIIYKGLYLRHRRRGPGAGTTP